MSATDHIRVSLVIPAYNEANVIRSSLERICQYLTAQGYAYEIIVVNDGSVDETGSIIESMLPTISHMRLITLTKNRGKGYAIRAGMGKANGEVIFFIDADGSTPISEIEKALPYFESGYDMVFGSRRVKGARVIKSQNKGRVFLGNAFNILVRNVLDIASNDTQCGFKGMTNHAAKTILSKCKIDRWAFDPELLVVAQNLGFQAKEVPVVWESLGKTKLTVFGMAGMFVDVCKIRWNMAHHLYQV